MSNLLLSHTLVHLEQGIGAFRLEIEKIVVWNIVKVKMDQERGKNESGKGNLQKDGNWIKLGHVESLDGVRGDIQDAVLSWHRNRDVTFVGLSCVSNTREENVRYYFT